LNWRSAVADAVAELVPVAIGLVVGEALGLGVGLVAAVGLAVSVGLATVVAERAAGAEAVVVAVGEGVAPAPGDETGPWASAGRTEPPYGERGSAKPRAWAGNRERPTMSTRTTVETVRALARCRIGHSCPWETALVPTRNDEHLRSAPPARSPMFLNRLCPSRLLHENSWQALYTSLSPYVKQ